MKAPRSSSGPESDEVYTKSNTNVGGAHLGYQSSHMTQRGVQCLMAVVALRHISVQKRLFLVSKRISRRGFRAMDYR